MNVLILGSGGREHALAWKISQSPLLDQLFMMPGNAGTATLAENLSGDPQRAGSVLEAVHRHRIEYVVIGPEGPLAAGLADDLASAGIPCFGPSAAAARIESSKAFAKHFMQRHSIPTAQFQVCNSFQDAIDYLQQLDHEYVIKASGLAAGKGVFLPENASQAEQILREIMLEGSLGEAGEQVVIEQRLVGREASLLAFTDGISVAPMPAAQDHKRLLDGDRGPNTGGMGVFAPSPFVEAELANLVVDQAIQAAVDGLRAEGCPFVGVLYAGMILTQDGPQVLEYNCRFGDPETQALLPLLEGDLLEIMLACSQGRLAALSSKIGWKPGASVTVVLASQGYPGSYPSGIPISGLGGLPASVIAFHAGTAQQDSQVVTAGGRVLAISAHGADLSAARRMAYDGLAGLHFEGMHYRRDIARMNVSSAYARAGVDIEAGNRLVDLIRPAVHSTRNSHVLSDLGSFGGLFSAGAFAEMEQPLLVASTDGVGTKVMLARQAERHAGLGQDIVNHCINDILVQGARPLFFLDYLASSKLDPQVLAAVVQGMADSCREAGCALLGGETAEMPGVYAEGQMDVVGTIVGVVEQSRLLPKDTVEPGDQLLGLASSGPHTNGYSLIRRVFQDVPLDRVYPEIGLPLADVLLAPHRSYLGPLGELLSAVESPLKALAHVTGGGFFDNLPRVLPPGQGAVIRRKAWPVPALFSLIQRLGEIAEQEMYRVFNMGVGMVAVISPAEVERVQEALGVPSWIIGEIVSGQGVTLV